VRSELVLNLAYLGSIHRHLAEVDVIRTVQGMVGNLSGGEHTDLWELLAAECRVARIQGWPGIGRRSAGSANRAFQ
jgi:hypothetical protein